MLSYDEMNKISEILQLVNSGNIKKATVQLITGEATIYKVKDIVRIDIKGDSNE